MDNVPKKGFCECSVGKCGLCCHVIAILLQLEHFITHKRLLLSLTCTQKERGNLKAAAHISKYFRNAKSARHVTQRKKVVV